jgi:LuxR family maltose regulon positive regulatory protein
LSEDPWLLFWLGMSYRPAFADKARHCFENAFDLFQKGQSWIGIYLAWSKIIDSIVLAWDDFKRLDPWIDWLDRHPLSGQPSLSVEIQAKVACCMAGALIIRKPHHPQLTRWIDLALELSQETADFTTQLKSSIWAATYYMWTGDVAHAELVKEKARRLLQGKTPSPVTNQFWQWLEISADIRAMKSPETVLRNILQILKEADAKGEHLMDQMFFPPGMFAAMVTGELSKAETLLARFGALPDDSHRHGHAIFHHFKGVFHMIQGRNDLALAHAETALKMVRRTGYMFYEALCLFQMAHLFQIQTLYSEAEDYLTQSQKIAVKAKSRLLEFMCQLEKARILLSRGDRQAGRNCLRDALALGRQHGYMVMIWWWDPVMISELCAEALTAGIEVDYIHRMIRVYNLSTVPPAAFVEAWPWKIKVYTLGRFRILLNDEPLRFKAKPPRKPLELLQALIAFGGVNVPVDSILDALWYDTDGDLAHSAFSTALNRLRKLLGTKKAIQLHKSMISLDANLCWIDALAFQDMLSQDGIRLHFHETEEIIRFYEKALDMYQGLFLSGEDATPWIISARERLKNKYLSCITQLGRLTEQAGSIEKAMAYYEKGLGIDDLLESLYQRLMACQLRLGRHADVARTYQRCRNRLAAALDVDPSAETEAIFNHLRN